MKQKNEKIENTQKTDKIQKMNFFRKLWCSITKIEKYPQMAAEGVKSALKYLCGLILILAIIIAFVTAEETKQKMGELSEYVQNEVPEFSYNNEEGLQIQSEEAIVKENRELGKIIIDTNEQEQEKINEYKEQIKDNGGIILLKDRFILSDETLEEPISYNYQNTLKRFNLENFNKETLIKKLNVKNNSIFYADLLLIYSISAFINYFLTSLINVVLISLFGWITAALLKLKIKYKAIFNMSVYSITLSTILYMAYIGLNAFYSYTIEYFDVMYIVLASIYIISSIFMLNVEFTKKQGEVQKIEEIQKIMRENDDTKEGINNDKNGEDNKKENSEKDDEKGDIEDSENKGEEGV